MVNLGGAALILACGLFADNLVMKRDVGKNI
ncbi:MAG: hypothetical protein ACI9X0_001615 [Kiritimatiellia bacterium]|jgi:hypothetical protein